MPTYENLGVETANKNSNDHKEEYIGKNYQKTINREKCRREKFRLPEFRFRLNGQEQEQRTIYSIGYVKKHKEKKQFFRHISSLDAK